MLMALALHPLVILSAMCTPVQWSLEGSAGVQVPVQLGIAHARFLVAYKAVKRMQENVERFDVYCVLLYVCYFIFL